MKRLVYKVEEYAALAQVHRETVYKWIKEGSIEAKKIGKRWLIPYYELPAFMREETEKEEK